MGNILKNLFWVGIGSVIVFYLIFQTAKTPPFGVFTEGGNEFVAFKETNFANIRLLCKSENTYVISEDSQLKCRVSLISKALNYSGAEILLQIVPAENRTQINWGCSADLNNISTENFSEGGECKSFFYNDTFIPLSVEKYYFKLYSLSLEFNGTKINEIQNGDQNFFEKGMAILSRNEEINARTSVRNLWATLLGVVIAVVAILVGPVIAKYSIEKNFEYERKLHEEKQLSLLKTLKLELNRSLKDSEGYIEETEKRGSIPL